jgi:hypothetical protein
VNAADDKERLFGLVAAPIAAAIALLVVTALISNNPPALLKNGQANRLHVSPSLYEALAVVLVALSLAMLVAALLRKRVLLGIVMALYGLAMVNLRFWGFGIPFILVSAWLLVRAYRFQRELRESAATAPPATGAGAGTAAGAPPRRSTPRPSKRYTAPGSSRRPR